jgi:hypothetical protein
MPSNTQTVRPRFTPTGHRKYIYRVIKRPANNLQKIEEALNKFAGFGYSLKGERVVGSEVFLTLSRRARSLSR